MSFRPNSKLSTNSYVTKNPAMSSKYQYSYVYTVEIDGNEKRVDSVKEVSGLIPIKESAIRQTMIIKGIIEKSINGQNFKVTREAV